jgi:hypothetical protein
MPLIVALETDDDMKIAFTSYTQWSAFCAARFHRKKSTRGKTGG